MSRPFLRRTVGALACACVPLIAAQAGGEHQSRTAAAVRAPAVVGIVTDSVGRPLPNVSVAISALGRVTTSDEGGNFALRGLPAGAYHVTATLVGFRAAHADVVLGTSGPDVRVTLVMLPAAIRLSGVVVTASPTGGDEDNLTQAASELSGKALNRALGSTIAQTLSAEPGIAMRFNGPAANAPIIRGLQGDRILILQDGERAGDLAAAAPDHAVSIDPLGAQRIEVVRGPASLLYGNNALGGVVNVITNDIPTSIPSHLEGSVATSVESAAPGAAGFGAITAPIGDAWAFTVRGGMRRAGDQRLGGGGTLAQTQSRAWNGTIGLGFQTDRVNGGAVLRSYDFDYGLPNEPGAPETGTRIAGRKQVASLKTQLQSMSALLPSLDVDLTAQHYWHDEIAPTGSVNTRFDLRTQTLDLRTKTVVGRARGVLGVQGVRKQYSATGDDALTPAATSAVGGIYLYQDLPLSPTADADDRAAHLQAGVRYDAYRIETERGDPKFGAATSRTVQAISGSVGVSLPLTEAATLGVSLARGFRAPTVEELFSNAYHDAAGTYDRGNPSLQAETNSGVDAILRLKSASLSGSVGAYYSRVTNYVAPSIVGDTLVGGALQPLNTFVQSDAELTGVEGSLEAILAPHVVGGVSGDLVRGRFRDGANIPFMPAARVGASLRYDRGEWNVGGEVRHAFAQQDVSGGTVDVPTAAYTLLNVSAGYQVIAGGRVHAVTLRVDNLTDARFFDAASRIKSFAANPGRNLALVYKVLF